MRPKKEKRMTLLFEDRLFKHHTNGSIGDYIIKVIKEANDNAMLSRTSTKVLGGKPVETLTEIVGKNIGRANETSSEDQAVKEALAKIKKQLDKGYVRTLDEASAPATNALNLPLPMLATPIEKIKEADRVFPCQIQAKLDGHRCLATTVDGQVLLYSRGGKPIILPHIKEALQKLVNTGVWAGGNVIDSELYIHGRKRDEIASMVKKLTEESKEVEYHIYDCITDDKFEDRSNYVINILEEADKPIVCAPTFTAHSFEEVKDMHREFLGLGFEGTMLRFNEPYEAGKRSKFLIKFKDFQDAEFEIVAHQLGKPSIRPNMTYQLPIFTCREPKTGELFNVTAPGTMVQRHALYEQGLDNCIGKQLGVKFFEYTDATIGNGKGVPFLPVAIDIREDL
jgi:ATP-dependent DNA ligase